MVYDIKDSECKKVLRGNFYANVVPVFAVNQKPIKVGKVVCMTEYKYIPEQIRINPNVIFGLIRKHKCNALAGVLEDICKQLMKSYNTNVVVLEPVKIAAAYKLSRTEVDRALKILTKENIITRFKDCEEKFEDAKVSKYTYFVTVNYVFYGNAEQAEIDYNNKDNHLIIKVKEK